jgi:hypothetical protein
MHNTSGLGPCGKCGGKCKYASGGDVKKEEMPKEHVIESIEMAPKEEGDQSDELHEMCAQELMSALESKDKKGVLDAIKAIVLSMGDK